ncbi:hypothetical protein RND71_018380 [Anisodus tanguticus]|uniref:Uncharacterized protein n=1 Tax=Anisodus tanguticus TaxID=243964 RepID=A0AAE1S5A6_9SOLA|nr:hypothetical protein RND71_018380 [Anisodus tanguticus]
MGSSTNATKKPVWNKLSSGVVKVCPVTGAVSWPTLSESTKPSEFILDHAKSASIHLITQRLTYNLFMKAVSLSYFQQA